MFNLQRGSRWWFQIFFIFTPPWGRFPFWLIFFRWVETTNQGCTLSKNNWQFLSPIKNSLRVGFIKHLQFDSFPPHKGWGKMKHLKNLTLHFGDCSFGSYKKAGGFFVGWTYGWTTPTPVGVWGSPRQVPQSPKRGSFKILRRPCRTQQAPLGPTASPVVAGGFPGRCSPYPGIPVKTFTWLP